MPHYHLSDIQGWIEGSDIGLYQNNSIRIKTHNRKVEEPEIKDNEKFLKYVNKNYTYLQRHLKAWCFNTHRTFNQDIFQDTILKIYNLITKNGKAKDNSDYGYECLFFRAYSTNLDREQQYARVKLKDDNNTNLFDQYEDYKNQELTTEEKVLSDAKKDYAVKYILMRIEENFPTLDFRIYRIKLYYECTYKKLVEMTNVKDAKTRIMRINRWVKENITKKEIDEAFEELQEEL